ncbi:MXAN_5187 C-terminal domain-containing protein [Desulfuromonas thiophila]|uniref:Uncharacterized protein n=1 Tax=Desulfuromonas thiophila TaxID=57664 RepID=A0A1G7E6Z0_9BACT|nr:MXAN_5187 C-terminal domain-containing protein [Desulfuromonas thiophila]MDD3802417.1 hypothetical protein [Desulfuromonas thiophila]SDE59457.1 hypothetical protein SAMN05661003_11820 [Desulfuromonas thiophila]
MDERRRLTQNLTDLEQQLADLRLQYEQYFAGVEKRAPLRARETLERQLRQLTRRPVMQTELRLRLQNLSARFYSYASLWERLQRQLDEGRQQRGNSRPLSRTETPTSPGQQLYQEYLAVCRQCQVPASLGDVGQIERLLEQQRRKIEEKYGAVQCSFRVVNENGRPVIRAQIKRP